MEGTKVNRQALYCTALGYSVLAFLETADEHMRNDFFVRFFICAYLVDVGEVSASFYKTFCFSVGCEGNPNIEIPAIIAVEVPNAGVFANLRLCFN